MAKVFLNISNHPATKWAAEQKSAALALIGGEGEIVDIPFPEMDPERVDWQYVKAMAEEVMAAVRRLQGVAAAMVQGEACLSTLIVRELQSIDIACYAATTKRQVEEHADGTKVSRFVFRAFRPYPVIG